MKKIFTIDIRCHHIKALFVLISVTFLLGAKAQYTPKGSFVSSAWSPTTEWTTSEINTIHNDISTVYNNTAKITRIGPASKLYNCHAYTWHITEGGSNYWIDNPTIYTTDGSYSETTSPVCHTKVLYMSSDHSAVATGTTDRFISKWGSWALMEHDRDYSPYDATDVKYYNRNYSISGPDAFCSSSSYNIQSPLAPTPPATIVWSEYITGRVSFGTPGAPATTVTRVFDDFVDLNALVTYNTCTSNPINVQKVDIMVGFPYFSALGVGPSGNNTIYPYTYHNYSISVPSGYPSASYSWTVPSGWSIISGQGTESISVQCGALGSGGPVEVDITACGLTRNTHKYVEVSTSGSGEPDIALPRPGKAEGKVAPDISVTPGRVLAVTPNPARDQVVVTLTKRVSTAGYNPSIREVRITASTGAVAKSVSFNNNLMSQRISVTGIAAGMYVISVYDGKFWYNDKLIILK